MFFRMLRYVKYCRDHGKRGGKTTPGLLEVYWLLAYFTKDADRQYIQLVLKHLRDVASVVLPNRTYKLKTWERLWRFGKYDRKYFYGVDLNNAPTRSMLCLLLHYGDLNEHDLLKYWDWATSRDSTTKLVKWPSQHEFEVLAMQHTIQQTTDWVNIRKTQCQPSNTTAIPTDCQRV